MAKSSTVFYGTHLQKKVGTKDLAGVTKFFRRIAPNICRMFSVSILVGPKKSPQFRQISLHKNHQRSSVEVKGKIMSFDNFEGKWPQEISRKISTQLHKAQNSILSQLRVPSMGLILKGLNVKAALFKEKWVAQCSGQSPLPRLELANSEPIWAQHLQSPCASAHGRRQAICKCKCLFAGD